MEQNMPQELLRLYEAAGSAAALRRVITRRSEIFPEEEKMPLYRYFTDHPLYYPPEAVMEYIERHGKIRADQAIQPQRFTDLLDARTYSEREIGYCLFPDGSGYVAAYVIRHGSITDEMEQWYRKWRRSESRSMVYGHGNLRYKIANPADLYDCHYVNHKDEKLGTYYRRSVGGKECEIIRHGFSLEQFGVDRQRVRELNRQGCSFCGKGYYETFGEPGTNLCLSLARPCPLGGTEIRIRKWLGWRPVNGLLIRDPYTQCTQEHLKETLIQILVEREHLYSFLHELYEEYHDLPLDAD